MRIPIINKDIHPRAAFNRWSSAVRDGIAMQNPSHIPQDWSGGRANQSFYWLGKQPGIGQVLDYALANPELSAAGLVGGTVVNNLIGNPVGGAIDFLSLGLTNLKPDDYIPDEPQVVISVDPEKNQNNNFISNTNGVIASPNSIAVQPGMSQQSNQVEIPQLNEEEKAKFMKYTTNRTAQQILAYQALQQYLNQQPGMEDNYGMD